MVRGVVDNVDSGIPVSWILENNIEEFNIIIIFET